MNRISANLTIVLVLSFCVVGQAQQSPSHQEMAMHMEMSHDHTTSASTVTFAELERTASQLQKARSATEKYRDVTVAEADGYRAIGPDVPGMGIHYVRVAGSRRSDVASNSSGFDVEHPDILLYEKDAASRGGYSLVGVSYLFDAEPDTDGQPRNSPFPKSLASWHRHSDLCVFPDRSVKGQLNAEQCTAQGGRFTDLTQWMVHAWIWKDSPKGVFSETNPNVR
jgi:hypothetical protein